jgi:hypothetical protein
MSPIGDADATRAGRLGPVNGDPAFVEREIGVIPTETAESGGGLAFCIRPWKIRALRIAFGTRSTEGDA